MLACLDSRGGNAIGIILHEILDCELLSAFPTGNSLCLPLHDVCKIGGMNAIHMESLEVYVPKPGRAFTSVAIHVTVEVKFC